MRRALVWAVVITLITGSAVLSAPKKRGNVKVAGKGLAVEMEFTGGQKFVVTSKAVRIPVGTYTPESYSLMMKDRSGKICKLESRRVTGAEPWSFTVEEGETAELDVGPPIKIVPIRYRSAKDRSGQKIIPVGYQIVGKQGEHYAHGVLMGSRRLPAPFFQIVDGNDKVLAEGQFEYG